MNALTTSTLDRPRSCGTGTQGSPVSCGLEPGVSDAVIVRSPDQASGAVRYDSATDGGEPMPPPRRIQGFPIPKSVAKRRYFKETDRWEGRVVHLSAHGIIAVLSCRYQDFPAEEAAIPWDEIDPADRDLVREGATFHWKVGYLEIDGQRFSVSHIEFRHAQNFTPREQATATAKAAEYASLFDA
ncbi:MAG: hypothetical protein NTW21_20485 [Verrucomicrobia bacterium]|nr:hypothetical protein [Verrucomicrobiota bacterium]